MRKLGGRILALLIGAFLLFPEGAVLAAVTEGAVPSHFDAAEAADSELTNSAADGEIPSDTADDELPSTAEDRELSGSVENIELPSSTADGDASDTGEQAAAGDKADLTYMFYAIGSDLERVNCQASFDMTEMMMAYAAARQKAGKELPVNLIMETGGSCYDYIESEDPPGTTRKDKLEDRKAAITYQRKKKTAYFKKYNTDAAALMEGKSLGITAEQIFDGVTAEGLIEWDQNQRWEVDWNEKTNVPALIPSKNPCTAPNRSMASSEENGVASELYEFVKTTVEQYPAKQYILILWDHGAGVVTGFGQDERDILGGSYTVAVDPKDIAATLHQVRTDTPDFEGFAMAGYDACLMGGLEICSAWQPYTDYLVASEDLLPGAGFYYVPWLCHLMSETVSEGEKAFSSRESMQELTLRVGKELVDNCVDYYKSRGISACLTLADLREAEPLQELLQELDTFSATYLDIFQYYVSDGFVPLYNARKNCVGFPGRYSNAADLESFFLQLQIAIESQDMYGIAKETLFDAMERMISVLKNSSLIAYHKNTLDYEDRSTTLEGTTNMFGLSCYFPYNGNQSDKNWRSYLALYGNDGKTGKAYRDLIGFYNALYYVGTRMYLYDPMGPQNEENADAAQEDFEQCIQDYDVTTLMPERLEYDGSMIYYDRLKESDTILIQKEDGYWYANNGNRDFSRGYFLHGYLNCFGWPVDLGTIQAGERFAQSEDQIRLPDYSFPMWLSLSNKDFTVGYPACIYRSSTSYGDSDAMTGELECWIPARMFTETPERNINRGLILLHVAFYLNQSEGKILGYSSFNPRRPEESLTSYSMDELTENEVIYPVYSIQKDGTVQEFKDKNGKYLLSLPFQTLHVSRGVFPLNYLENMQTALKNWENEERLSANVNLEVPYTVRDYFDNEYETEKKSLMVFNLLCNGKSSIVRMKNEYVYPEELQLQITTNDGGSLIDPALLRTDTEEIAYYMDPDGETKHYVTDPVKVEGDYTFFPIYIDEDDLTPERLIRGFDQMTEEKQMEYRAIWDKFVKRVDSYVYIQMLPRYAADNLRRSGMLPGMTENGEYFTMIKGQSYDLRKDGYTDGVFKSDDPECVSVSEKGIMKAKNPCWNTTVTYTARDGKETLFNVDVSDPMPSEAVYYEGFSVAYHPIKRKLMKVGDTTEFVLATYTKGEGELILASGRTAMTTSNPKVVEVNGRGGVEAVGTGSATVTLYLNGKSYPIRVTVVNTPSKGTGDLPSRYGSHINADGSCYDNITLAQLQTLNLKSLSYYPDQHFSPAKARWGVWTKEGNKDTDGIVRIEKGKLTAISQGRSTVYGVSQYKGRDVCVWIDVQVKAIPDKKRIYLNPGDSAMLKNLHVNNRDSSFFTSMGVPFVVENIIPSLKGRVSADISASENQQFQRGKVTCIYENSTLATEVVVENPSLTEYDMEYASLKLNPKKCTAKKKAYDLTLDNGCLCTLSTPGILQSINWKTANSKIVFVDEAGIVEALKPGKTTVKTRINGISLEVDVTVLK